MLNVIGIKYNRYFKEYWDRNLFYEIKNEEDAYWLGFILADGYLNEDKNSLSIQLGAKDIGHLYKFCDFCKCSYDRITKTIGGFGTECYGVRIYGKQIKENLIKKGIRQAKSMKEIPFYDIREDLKPHYIRGIIDGDGFIRKKLNGFGFCGSYEVNKFILDFLDLEESRIKVRELSKDGINKLYGFGIINKKILLEFVKKIYKDSTIFLDRKMNLANKILNI